MEKLFKKIKKLGGVTKSIQKFDVDKSVKKLEDIYKGKLPEEYVQLQKKYGGFAFNNDIVVKAVENHPVLGDDGLVSLDFFYGLEPEGENSIYNRIQNYKDRIPTTFLPICDGEMNDLICIDLSASNYGKIYFWVSDTGADEKESFLIANNISDLILNAYVEDEDSDADESHPQVNWDDEKYKKMNPTLLDMLKKHHEKENKK